MKRLNIVIQQKEDKLMRKFTVLAIEQGWYHLKDSEGNIHIINNRNIAEHYKVVFFE